MKALEYIFTKQQIRDRFFWLRLGLAIVMVLMLVGQLFTYEDFYDVLGYAHGNLGLISVALLVVLLPAYELLALPSLLTMRVSKKLLRASAYVARAISLLLVALMLNAWIVAPRESSGLLGGTVAVPAHFLTVIVVALYAGLVWFATRGQVEGSKKK